MRVLLVRPISANERFGLGPFFRVEPLGLEYIAAALIARGHEVRIADLRFGQSLQRLLRTFRPAIVGVACLHIVDVPGALETARAVKRHDRATRTLVGGHAAATFPKGVFDAAVDAIAVEDGEATVPAFVTAVQQGRPIAEVPGLWVLSDARSTPPTFMRTPPGARIGLDEVPVPARHLVAPFQHHYRVVHKSPLYAVETARGCPFRCTFCSIWRLHERTTRARSIASARADLQRVGENVFVVDDLFWYPKDRSLELCQELLRSGVRKDFVLVQSRLDLVARNPALLEAWRPVSRLFDIFFGFEAPTERHLAELDKDFDIAAVEEGVRVARHYGYGVSGNFVVDPDWDEHDFQAMWDLVDRLKLTRAGYTIMTPLPGTPLYDTLVSRIQEPDLSKFDMHHILYEPKLGRRRFFELFTESWKRNVLGAKSGARNWLRWFREVRLSQLPVLARTLYHAQRNLSTDAYLAEAFPLQIPSMAHPREQPESRSGLLNGR